MDGVSENTDVKTSVEVEGDLARVSQNERLEDTVDEIASFPLDDMNSTRSLRIAAARELYAHPEHIDWRRLALLEIFESTTLSNLRENPFA